MSTGVGGACRSLRYAGRDPSYGVTPLNSPRAGRQQGQVGSGGCAGGPRMPRPRMPGPRTSGPRTSGTARRPPRATQGGPGPDPRSHPAARTTVPSGDAPRHAPRRGWPHDRAAASASARSRPLAARRVGARARRAPDDPPARCARHARRTACRPPQRARPRQDLRHDDGARGRGRRPGRGGVARRHGPLGLGQVDAPALPRGHPAARPGRGDARGSRRRCALGPRAVPPAPRALRLRVPVRPAAARAAGRGERRAPAHAAGDAACPGPRRRPAVARGARPGRHGAPSPGRAVGRAGPARRRRARALITGPDVVFADEPTGALDQATGADVMRVLTEATRAAGASLVVVTHDENVAAWCSRRIEVRDGRVVGS